MADSKEYLQKPFCVIHDQTKDVIAGFDAFDDAKNDADARNDKARAIGTAARYTAIVK